MNVQEAGTSEAEGGETSEGDTGLVAPVRDGEHVMVCLKRALKITHAAQQQLAVALKASDS